MITTIVFMLLVALTASEHPAELQTVVVKLAPGVDAASFAVKHEMDHVRSLAEQIGEGYHEFRVHASRRRHVLKKFSNHSGVEWAEHQTKRRRYTRSADPLFGRQWHLHAVAPGLNVDELLRQGIDGTGVTIAVVDDGVEKNHPDLRHNLKLEWSHDFNGRQGSDPSPTGSDSHGTAAAGVACARRDNEVCGAGVASGANLVGIRLIAAGTSDLDEAEGLGWQRSNVDVVSCSWGPQDDGSRMEAPGRLVQEVFERGVRQGRDGKGTIFVWAGGNGAEYADNCNYDAYANDFRTISVSAVDSNNKPAWYSEPCAMHLVTAPSSGLYSNGVSTDTLHGQCTTRFGGTSAAAPMIAGAVANVLQVNPELRWRDVQALIAKTAKKVPGLHDGWSRNGRGYQHSHHFGFGYLDLPETVAAARAWKHLPPMTVCTTRVRQVGKAIPQNGNGDGPLTYPIVVVPSDQCMAKIDFIESVGLRMHVRHSRRGQVSVRLRDPEGTVSILAEERGDYHSDYPEGGWLFGSMRHFGARPYGGWSVIVYDTVPDHNRGTLEWAELIIRGHKEA